MMNHNDFPKMTEEFDRSVRRALDSLPERESKPVRRFSAKKIVCAGLAAALCIGGTAFAANAQSWFPLLFPNGGDANLEGYVQTADSAKLTDENEHYRLSVESVLFDESAGTGVISLHLENKKQDGVKPFTLAHLIDSYRNKPDITWSTLSSCYAEEGQFAFEVMYGDSGFCGSEFYLDTARSTDNDYYFEGAFAISSDYRQGEPLRLEALEPGKTTVRADGAGTAKTVLAVDLPEFVEEVRPVKLEQNAQKVYDGIEKDSFAELMNGEITTHNVLTQLLRLSQITGGFVRNDDGDDTQQLSTAKLDALEDVIDSCMEEGKKVIVFARFVPEIDAIARMLRKKNIGYALIKGDVKDRAEQVSAFQTDPDTKVFVGQLQTTGMGLTLTAGSVCVYYSLDFSYANYQQSMARVRRIGQTKRVVYIHLVCKDTIDEKVMGALKQKADVSKLLVDDYKKIIGG